MAEGLTCGKCKAPLEINSAQLIFKGGKKTFIKCSKCNSVQRIAYDVVKHLLKSNSEGVKKIEEIHKFLEEKGITPEEPIKSPSAEPEPVKQETTEKEQEINAPEGVIWGAIAALLAVIVSIVGILWYWWKNRKEGDAT